MSDFFLFWVLFFLPDMFDKTRSGRIDLFGFSALWNYIQQWRALFQQYDRDHSGSISGSELHQGIHVSLFCLKGAAGHIYTVALMFFCLLLLFLQLSLRWDTNSAPSFLRCWCSASAEEEGPTAYSWTASSRRARSSRA